MPLIIPIDGVSPQIDPTAWIAPNATLIGKVRIGPKASVYYGAVLRGDISEIVLGEGSNLQDNVVVHTDFKAPAIIGSYVGVGHGAIIHSAIIDDGSLIGMGATLLNNAHIGTGAFVGAGSLVREGQIIPAHHLAVGVPAKVRGELDAQGRERVKTNAYDYLEITARHRQACAQL